MEMISVLDNWLDPVITPDVARRLMALEADQALTRRVLELGEKANAGTLTYDERLEYDGYISANDIMAVLQSKAREVLRRFEIHE